jgi:hypothetical protein
MMGATRAATSGRPVLATGAEVSAQRSLTELSFGVCQRTAKSLSIHRDIRHQHEEAEPSDKPANIVARPRTFPP